MNFFKIYSAFLEDNHKGFIRVLQLMLVTNFYSVLK